MTGAEAEWDILNELFWVSRVLLCNSLTWLKNNLALEYELIPDSV